MHLKEGGVGYLHLEGIVVRYRALGRVHPVEGLNFNKFERNPKPE